MQPTPSQRRLARSLIATLDGAPVGTQPLGEVVAQLPTLLGADQAAAFLVHQRKLEFYLGAQMPAGIRGAYVRWLKTAPRRFASYDPERPEARQRNLALRTVDLQALNGNAEPAVKRTFLPRFELSQSDQLRALVCDGASLLAWVGGFRKRPFTRAELRVFAALVPALQRRLSLERRLAEVQQRAKEIGAALEHVPAAAFVVAKRGVVLHANAAGRAMLERDRALVAERLRPRAPGTQVARLCPDGELRLAIVQQPAEPDPLVAVARVRWGLTPRQEQVLRLLARGMSNRAIAAALECAENTVELHVTALLDKSQAESRAHLVARLWSGS